MKKKNPDNELVTKSYLKQEFDNFREEIKQELTKFRSKIFDRLDAVMKELVAIRQEQTLHFHKHENVNETLENHEGRIKNLEGQKFA